MVKQIALGILFMGLVGCGAPQTGGDALLPQQPGNSDLYFLGVAGPSPGAADDVLWVSRFFEEQFKTIGRSLVISSDPDIVSHKIDDLASLLDPNEDTLFIYLNNDHPAVINRDMLDSAGIGWRVIVEYRCEPGAHDRWGVDPLALRLFALGSSCAGDSGAQLNQWLFADAMLSGLDPMQAFDYISARYPIKDHFLSIHLYVGAAMTQRLHQVELAVQEVY